MKQFHLILCLFVGLCGGILSRYLWIPPVLAQAQTPTPKEVRSQSFVIVDEMGQVQGVFTSDHQPAWNGRSRIKLVDPSGRVIWSAPASAGPLSSEVISK